MRQVSRLLAFNNLLFRFIFLSPLDGAIMLSDYKDSIFLEPYTP